MAFAASNLTAEPRAMSAGPYKIQLLTWTVASGDTAGTITCDSLYRVDQVYLSGGLTLTSAPTYSGNVVTLAFVNPAATRYGTALVFGK
jgi:hypothetical protein